jgi:energy-coupling factor transporter ATP-binding protein EcfA2
VEAAAALAGFDEVLPRLPHGLDTLLSTELPDGVDLSGGQWQRLALARALFATRHGASLLVLDEPTAALDVRSEARFYARFFEITAGLTTVVVSHRFATVRRAHQILVLEDGVVAERGDHEELVAAGGPMPTCTGYRLLVDGALEGDTATAAWGVVVVAGLLALGWALTAIGATEAMTLSDRIAVFRTAELVKLIGGVGGLEHLERHEYLANVEALNANRRQLAAAPRQLLSNIASLARIVALLVLLATVSPRRWSAVTPTLTAVVDRRSLSGALGVLAVQSVGWTLYAACLMGRSPSPRSTRSRPVPPSARC